MGLELLRANALLEGYDVLVRDNFALLLLRGRSSEDGREEGSKEEGETAKASHGC